MKEEYQLTEQYNDSTPLKMNKRKEETCGNSREDISLLSEVGKMYGKVVEDRVKEITGGLVDAEERDALLKVEDAYIFPQRLLVEKYLKKD